MIEKNGMLTKKSHADFGLGKKAEYYDEETGLVSDRKHRKALKKPTKIKEENR
jgi:hypothetical protein